MPARIVCCGGVLMLWDILASAAVAALLLLFIWKLRGVLLTPVRTGENTSLTVRLDVNGPEPLLESTLASLLWLDGDGTLKCSVEVRDLGMDEATLAVAEAFEREGRISIVREGN